MAEESLVFSLPRYEWPRVLVFGMCFEIKLEMCNTYCTFALRLTGICLFHVRYPWRSCCFCESR